MLTFNTLQDEAVIESLRDGLIGVIPTDTVYGLACSALQQNSVSRLYSLKNREAKPGTLLAANIDQVIDLGIPRRYLKAVDHYWPSSISVVVPTVVKLSYLDQGIGSLAVRIPDDDVVHELLLSTGPLITTSANKPGEQPSVVIAEAKAHFGDVVDFYVDGGDLSDRLSSTIIRVVDDAVEVLRQGAVKINEKGEIIQ